MPKNLPISIVYLLLQVLVGWFSISPGNSQNIVVKGIAVDKASGNGLPGLMVLNRRTGLGYFGEHTGEFKVRALKTDTLRFSVIGYAIQDISFMDSIIKEEYYIELKLSEIRVELRHLDVFPVRSLEEIKKDIDELGVAHNYQVEGLGALQSPVTFLYERFSRFEKQKRKAAELYNEEARKDILKELFRKYIKAEIIELDEKEFEEFIYFCNLPEHFIKSATQFDLVMAVKTRFEAYLWLKQNNGP